MNIFNDIYSTDIDPIERSFIIAETTFEIEIERVNKEYMYEMGLIDLGLETTFCETANTNRENAFVKFVKGIFNGIRNLLDSVADAIRGIFDKRKHIELDDVAKSEKFTLSRDVRKLDKAVDDEIERGRKLLKKSQSSTLTKQELDSWVDKSIERIKNVAPTVINIGSALGLGTIIKDIFKKHKNKSKQMETDVTNASNANPDKNGQQKTILNHTATIMNLFTTLAQTVGKEVDKKLDKQYAKYYAEIDKEHKSKTEKIRKKHSSIAKGYKSGKIDLDDDQLIAATTGAEADLRKADAERNAARDKVTAIKTREKQLIILRKAIEAHIGTRMASGELSKPASDTIIAFYERQLKMYKKDPTAEAYKELINNLKNRYPEFSVALDAASAI